MELKCSWDELDNEESGGQSHRDRMENRLKENVPHRLIDQVQFVFIMNLQRYIFTYNAFLYRNGLVPRMRMSNLCA